MIEINVINLQLSFTILVHYLFYFFLFLKNDFSIYINDRTIVKNTKLNLELN